MSVWSFVVPALIILAGIANYFILDYYIQNTSRPMVIYRVTTHRVVDEMAIAHVEQISSDLENEHYAKADRELHQLKLSLEGKQ